MQTIGERLEEARKRKGISIREAAEATKIRGDYLQKFESNQFDLNLADIYVRGFLRGYAHFLKLPADKIVNDFNGLGLASGGRARTPSREVYGRMDLSVASGDEPVAPASAPSQAPAEAPPANTRRDPASFTRGGGNLHSGPSIDPALLIKGGLVVVGLIILLLIIWGIKSLVGGSTAKAPAPVAQTPVVQQPAPARTFTLVALDTLYVTVARRNPDGRSGEEIFKGTLVRGQNQVIPRPGPLLITASAAENLEIEINGRRFPTDQKGYKTMQLQ